MAKIRLKIFAFLAGYLGLAQSLDRFEVKRLAGLHFSRNHSEYRGPDAALRKNFRVTHSGKAVNRGGVTHAAQKRHFRLITNTIRSPWNIAEDPPSYDTTCL